MFGEKRRQVGRFEPADERTHVKEVGGEGCCRRCGGVQSEDVFLTCLEETQEVLRRLMLGCKEERFLTFLVSSLHCGGLMSRGRDRANVQMGGTKSIGAPVVPAGRPAELTAEEFAGRERERPGPSSIRLRSHYTHVLMSGRGKSPTLNPQRIG